MEITVYTQENCRDCGNVKKWLTRADVPFVEAPIGDEILARAKEQGLRQAPIFVQGDMVAAGFDVFALEAMAKNVKEAA